MKEILEILTEMHPDIDFLTYSGLIDNAVLQSLDIITLVSEINERLDAAIPAEEIVPENSNSYTAIKTLVDRLSD